MDVLASLAAAFLLFIVGVVGAWRMAKQDAEHDDLQDEIETRKRIDNAELSKGDPVADDSYLGDWLHKQRK